MTVEKPIRSAIRPKTNPIATSSKSIIRFSLRRLLSLVRMRIPTPALEKSPESIAPVLIIPCRPSEVSATEVAHPGISPIKAAIRLARTGTVPSASPIVSVPIKKISAFMISVITKTNAEMVSV